MKSSRLEELEKEIKRLKYEKENNPGPEAEVYTRIVGYYRSVRNWNRGKRQEFTERVTFQKPAQKEEEKSDISDIIDIQPPQPAETGQLEFLDTSENTPDAQSYDFFYRDSCPNCPPVKDFLSRLSLSGRAISVDTDEGLQMASELDVFSAPTVIFYNFNGKEIFRSSRSEELENYFTLTSAS